MMRVIEGETLPPPAVRTHPAGARAYSGFDWLIPLFVVALFAGGMLRAIFGRFVGAGVVGGVVGIAGWVLVGTLLVGVIAGVVAFFFAAGARRRLRPGAAGAAVRRRWRVRRRRRSAAAAAAASAAAAAAPAAAARAGRW